MEFDSATQHKIKHTNTKSLSHESLPVNLIFSFFLFLRNNNNNSIHIFRTFCCGEGEQFIECEEELSVESGQWKIVPAAICLTYPYRFCRYREFARCPNCMSLNPVYIVQSTLVISNSKGLSEILRDIRTSTYQICRTEEKVI